MTDFEEFSVHYGYNVYTDVTEILKIKCNEDSHFMIPSTDVERAEIFGDPVVGITKHILFKSSASANVIKVDVGNTIKVYRSLKNKNMISLCNKLDFEKLKSLEPVNKLKLIHNSLNLIGGSFQEEFPEQLMVAKFLPNCAKVLEIGANIGRNTLVIASLLENSANLVTMETDPETVRILKLNRDINATSFQIENSALSIKPLIQSQWTCSIRNENEPIPHGSFEVHTITWSELEKKYGLDFDTLVLDCEGSFFHMLQNFPEMLNRINLVIMENDYWNAHEKEFVNQILSEKGFAVVYTEAGGWGPCQSNFFEVWKKKEFQFLK